MLALTEELLAPVKDLVMCQSVGNGVREACVMHQAAIVDACRRGEKLEGATDKLACACPVLRRLAMRLNDGPWWADDEDRKRALVPLIDTLLDSRVDRGATLRRGYHAANFAIREFAAAALRSAKWDDLADRMSSVASIVDRATALAASEAIQKILSGARGRRKCAAAAYAYAAVDAAYAAAAGAAAYAAYAAYGACAAVDAAADAADADAAKGRVRDRLLVLFDEIAAIN